MDLLALGGITFDHLYWVDRLPKTHFEGVILRQGKFFGGRAPNVAVAAAKLGIKTGLVSLVGKDFSSEGYEDYLKKYNIDLRGVVVLPKETTKQILIFTDPAGNQITFFNYGAEAYFKNMEIPSELIKRSKMVYISSSGDYRFNIKSAKCAFESNIPVSFDPGNDPFTEIPEYLERMTEYTDFLFLNNLEAISFLKILGLDEISYLLNLGPKIVLVFDKWKKSAVIYTPEGNYQVPSFIKTMKDPTGCSDGFVAAFIAGIKKGFEIREAGLLGAIEASFIAEDFGSQTNLPTWNVLYEKYCEVIKHQDL